MEKRKIVGTLDEDLNLIGARDIGVQAALAGVPLVEEAAPQTPKTPEKVEEGSEDPLDGKVVTDELLTRMEKLPEENLTEELIEKLLAEMGEKECPDDLLERASAVTKSLLEGKFAMIKKRKGKKASKVRRQVAVAGFKSVGKPKTSTGKVKAGSRGKVVKVAPGKLKAEHRKQKRSRKTGHYKAKLKIRQRRAKRFESAFANELFSVLHEAVQNEVTLREEIMERTATIMDLMAEEFDEDVCQVLDAAWTPISEAYNAGRLDEATTTDEEFITALKPCLVVFAKAMDRFETMDSAQDPMDALRDLA